MALESCSILVFTELRYYHKVLEEGVSDGWKSIFTEELFLTEDFSYTLDFYDDENPTRLMPGTLMTFKMETEE